MSVVSLTDDNFEAEVTASDLPVLVDFYADWCGPCKMIGPVIKDLAEAYAGRLKVGKINIEEGRRIASRFKVMSIPTLMLFRSGQCIGQAVGAMPKAGIEAFLRRHAAL